MNKFSKKTFSIFSIDKDVGGISNMIEQSTEIMSTVVKRINLFVLDNTKTANSISRFFSKNKKVKVYKLSFYEKLLLKIGVFSQKNKKKIFESDLIFIHNYKLIRYLRAFLKFKPLILFFHTDKEKQIYHLQNVTKVFTVNSYTKGLINKIYSNNKASFLPNCISIKNKKYVFKKPKNKIIVGAMGRLVEKKGFKSLINVFKSIEDVELHIAGNGPLMSYYKKLIKGHNNIKLLGWIKDKDNFFSKVDIFFSSSNIEPFGLVILEAMIRSTPVISTKCNGPLDIIKHMNNGLLVDVDNIDEMKNSVNILKNDILLRKKISKNGFYTVKNKYNLNVYKKKLFSEIFNIR